MLAITKHQARHYLYVFLFIHFLCWAIIPACIRDNLPLDAIEGTIWGHNLEWGYDKNPFLNGWLTALAVYLDGHRGWMIYFFSQLSVIACFWSVWQLGKRILPPMYALLSVMLLEGIQYYNFHSIDFNDNTLELGLWGLACYFYYRALRDNSNYQKNLLYWICVGVFAALGMMAKYYTASLLTAMTIFLFLLPTTRKQLLTLPPYVGLLCFIIIITPHVVWLFSHDFITIDYVFQRTSNPPKWTNHILNPLQFAWEQLEVFIPPIMLMMALFIGKQKNIAAIKTFKLNTFDKQFLHYIGLGPFVLTLLLSILFGIKLRAGWGMPLQSLWGILLISYLQPVLDKRRIYLFMLSIYTMIAMFIVAYSISLIKSPDTSSANFPGRDIADVITEKWRQTYHTPLQYVAGSRWIGGNIEFYSKDRPAVFVEWNLKKAPWIKLDDLKKQGGVFVWNLTEHEVMPNEVKEQFQSLQPPLIMTFNWKRNVYNLPATVIAVALLPPA